MKRLAVLLLIAMFLSTPVCSEAQPTDEALAALASTSFDGIRRGVEALAISGEPRAAAIIDALQAGRLYMRSDKALFIRQQDGSFADAATGAAAPDVTASGVKAVR